MTIQNYDVILIGYGPVGQALALMLGRQGRSVAVCERWIERFPLPRAVCIDHEIYRILSANGMGDVLPEISHPGPLYQWFNSAWEELLVIDWSADSISGGPEVNFVHQPTLEKALRDAVLHQPSVELFLGWEVLEMQQDEEGASVVIRDFDGPGKNDGQTRKIAGKYLVGCDGANSIVRREIGSGQEDRGFEADWLVIDVLLKEGVTIEKLGIPAAGQYCNPLRPTTIVPAGVRDGRIFRRWEFMLLPGESAAEMEEEARVWELLKAWATPDEVELVRYKVYTFRSLLATNWRKDRYLLAGDAAHVMPPFMGQGMCSGIRDAWNLSWKLKMILDGDASDALLDTYQVERMPHVSQIIDLSIYLGKLICTPDPKLAAERDAAFKNGTAEPPPPFPSLTSGLLQRSPSGEVLPGVGLLAPHVSVRANGAIQRLDEVVGIGFTLIVSGADTARSIDAGMRSTLQRIGVRLMSIASEPSSSSFVDVDGRCEPFMAAQSWDAMIVRPDFYVYGGACGTEGLKVLVHDLTKDLQSAGVATAPHSPPAQ